MNCENIFCVYNIKNKCVVNEVSLDITGMCKDCIYIEIKNIDKYKHKNQE